MAVFKCKMCGGTLEVGNESVAVCEYCGTKQTLPKLDDDKRSNLYDRANHFRRNNEYDKALAIFEQILNEDPSDAEAYWSIVLCTYGIEYVEDPVTHKRVPTVNRAQYTSILADANYKAAVEHADGYQKIVYEEEAKAIDEIQKGILEISAKEAPFDVFICYKETDANGRRTVDSVLANDLYHQLTQEGFKVFFSRITLEDKLGSAYEPYIFAALNSSKVMVAIGTKPEHFNAVWVKNEWSRYLQLIRKGEKKMLIPAYRDMDPYDMPEEFSHLQAQDMSKLGFMQDLIRGIKKIVDDNKPKVQAADTVIINQGGDIAPLLKRANLFLEDRDFISANEYFEKVLDINPECGEAYLGKLLVDLKISRESDLEFLSNTFDDYKNYEKVLRFADTDTVNRLVKYNEIITIRNLEKMYDTAEKAFEAANNIKDFRTANIELNAVIKKFEILDGYKDSLEYIAKCEEKIKELDKDRIYNNVLNTVTTAGIETTGLYQKAINELEPIIDWKDSAELIAQYKEKIVEIERKTDIGKAKAKKTVKIVAPIVAAVAVVAIVLTSFVFPAINYNKGVDAYEDGDYLKAAEYFFKSKGKDDAKDYIAKINKKLMTHDLISTGFAHTIGLKGDGTVIISGEPYGKWDLSDWKDIIAVADSQGTFALGLKKDGTVVSAGASWTEKDRVNVTSWTDIIAVSGGYSHSVGLKKDGTVVATGSNASGQCNVNNWSDIIAVSAGEYHTIGLKSNGTVVATGNNNYGQCDVSNLKDIVAITGGYNRTICLKSDGTVIVIGYNAANCDVSNWTDIIAISSNFANLIGLKSDGTVVATGGNSHGQCNVSDWTDIIVISSGEEHTVGLKADGTVVAIGNNDYGQCDVENWNLF